MGNMFKVPPYLTIGDWKVGSVTDMDEMFNGVSISDQDISGWNVTEVYQNGLKKEISEEKFKNC